MTENLSFGAACIVAFLPVRGRAFTFSEPLQNVDIVNNPAAEVTDCLIKALRLSFDFFIVTGPLRLLVQTLVRYIRRNRNLQVVLVPSFPDNTYQQKRR